MWQKNKNHPWEKDANKVEFSLPHFSQSLLKDIIANKLLCILLGEIPPFSSVSWEAERNRERERVCVCVYVCVCACNWVITLISRMGKPRGCAWLFASPEDDMSFREGLEITAPLVHRFLALCLPYPQPVTRRPAHPQPWCGSLQPPSTSPWFHSRALPGISSHFLVVRICSEALGCHCWDRLC